MLDKILKVFGAYAVLGIILLISAAFILQFGPQADGLRVSGKSLAIEVGDEGLTLRDVQASTRLLESSPFGRLPSAQQRVVNGLVNRELLAQEAAKLGFQISDVEAMEYVLDNSAALVTVDANALPIGIPTKDKNGDLDKELMKNFITNGLRRTPGEFARSQAREQLADRMRNVVGAAVAVSPQEVWGAYVGEAERAKVEYFRFRPSFYADRIDPTEAEIKSWVSANQEKVDAEYERLKHKYTGLEKQVRAREILIKLEEDATDEQKAAAKARAEGVLRKAKAGSDFAKLARESSDEDATKARGGDLGYTPKNRRPAIFDETVFALEAGQVSELIETPQGYYIFKAESFREGDVPAEEAKLEIGEALVRDAQARAKAKDAAAKTLATWKSGKTGQAIDRELAGLPVLGEGETPPEDEIDPRDSKAPRFDETRSFGKLDSPISGVESSALGTHVFEDLTLEAPFSTEPQEVSGDYYAVKLVERERATEDDYTDEVRERIQSGLIQAKRYEAVAMYLRDLRAKADKDKAVKVNQALLDQNEQQNAR